MPDTISLTGVVATTPRHITTAEGLDITSFRLASSQRRFDKVHNSWADVGTNWYTITAFRQLAANMATSLNKGDRVVASGRLRIREWVNGDKNGLNIEVEAEAVGHDLSWGSAAFTRTLAPSTGGAASGSAAAGGAAAGSNASGEDSWRVPPPSGASTDGGGAADWGAGAFGVLPTGGASGASDAYLPDDESVLTS
ncbi:single-stranded DNA-binding protein [Subtercola lobariae]|uniref:Single-stranded DNA-binding protein n=1 Tax=Subtercola lobariae TaxID=1588641 RepID=A0A917BE44_9MICO|nr:single-stranded DNA-binding protein [Subtercola lobariae]GGF39618.1 hypothetical protein GCM10011399_35650 [Subtercola lobariae]